MLKYRSFVCLELVFVFLNHSVRFWYKLSLAICCTVHLPNFMNEETEAQASYQGAKINNGILGP